MSLLLALLAPPPPVTYDLWDEQDLMVEYADDAADLDAAQLIDAVAAGGDARDITDEPIEEPIEELDLVATFNENEPHGELIVEDEHLEELELTLELRVTEDEAVASTSDDAEDEEPPQLEADAPLTEQTVAPASDAELLASTDELEDDDQLQLEADGALPEQAAAPAADAELLASASDELDELFDVDDPAERLVDDAETPADPSGDAEHDEMAMPGALSLQVDDAAVVGSDASGDPEHEEHAAPGALPLQVDDAVVATGAELIASNDEEPDEMTDSLDTQLVDAAAFIADNAELLALIDLDEAEVWDIEALAETHPDTLIALVLRLRTLMGVGQ